MKRAQYGDVVELILSALGEFGPMSRIEIGDHLKIDRNTISSVTSRMTRASVRTPKRLHIVRYVHDHEGQRTYPRAVYAIGDKPDAKRPVSDSKAAKRRYNAKVKARHTANFVFNLALPRRVYENRRAE